MTKIRYNKRYIKYQTTEEKNYKKFFYNESKGRAL